jgi:L-ascorbate metabolism protein UlaG (beta-lactamase superfamily)
MNMAVVCAVVLVIELALGHEALRAQGLVKVTALGSHPGELCVDDRALLFDDPSGVRILYDPGFTTDETDPRLGDVHVILLSHAHIDHIGGNRPNRSGTCAAPGRGPANTSSNVATIAAAKAAAVFVTSEQAGFMGLKIQGVRGGATPGCTTVGLEGETMVPLSSPCTAPFGPGATRTVRRAGAAAPVRITGVQAVHPNSIPAALIDPPGVQPGIFGYGGVALGFVVQFTNGLTAYLTGDTGPFGDMGQVIAKFYNPNLVVINIGPGGLGPTSLGPRDAAAVIREWVRPTSVIPSHVQEPATSGGVVRTNTWTDLFMQHVRDLATVVVPLSDVVLAFDGEGRCVGCPRY